MLATSSFRSSIKFFAIMKFPRPTRFSGFNFSCIVKFKSLFYIFSRTVIVLPFHIHQTNQYIGVVSHNVFQCLVPKGSLWDKLVLSASQAPHLYLFTKDCKCRKRFFNPKQKSIKSFFYTPVKIYKLL
jgi:hypothetical protein